MTTPIIWTVVAVALTIILFITRELEMLEVPLVVTFIPLILLILWFIFIIVIVLIFASEKKPKEVK